MRLGYNIMIIKSILYFLTLRDFLIEKNSKDIFELPEKLDILKSRLSKTSPSKTKLESDANQNNNPGSSMVIFIIHCIYRFSY